MGLFLIAICLQVSAVESGKALKIGGKWVPSPILYLCIYTMSRTLNIKLLNQNNNYAELS